MAVIVVGIFVPAGLHDAVPVDLRPALLVARPCTVESISRVRPNNFNFVSFDFDRLEDWPAGFRIQNSRCTRCKGAPRPKKIEATSSPPPPPNISDIDGGGSGGGDCAMRYLGWRRDRLREPA